MIHWNCHRDFSHYLVDSGETFSAQYEQAPLLVGCCQRHDLAAIAGKFLDACGRVDVGVAYFIYARLQELPAKPGQHCAVHTDHYLK
jgi:hypothetical protein